MPATKSEAESARRELEDILKSPGFARNERLSQFLRFLVERHLEGRDHELRESVIGTEVFGRKPDYSPKQDPIVRTEARRLRKRLRQYYETLGENHAVRVEVPIGGYVPIVRCAEGEPGLTPAPRAVLAQEAKWRLVGLICAGLIIVLAVLGFTQFRRPRSYANSPAYDLYCADVPF